MTESPTADAEDIEETGQTRTNGKRAEMRPSVFPRKSSKEDAKTSKASPMTLPTTKAASPTCVPLRKWQDTVEKSTP